MDLTNLSPEHGGKYLRDQGVQGDDAELWAASEEFGNHALALTLLGPYLVNEFAGDVEKRNTLPALLVEPSKGGHARRIMNQYETLFAGKPELTVLRTVGLFDRPADASTIGMLRSVKSFYMGESEWKSALKHLQNVRLINNPGTEGVLDCHPLIREHFGEELKQSQPGVFRDAQSQLYEYYSRLAADIPDSLVSMVPLFYAVYHACKAERYVDAEKVYRKRIDRDEEAYLTKKLGAFGLDLALLANFFESRWGKAVSGLAPTAQSAMISDAAYSLRALGRLSEAIEPMKLGIEADIRLEDWKEAAGHLRNLSELHLTLGAISDAIESAEASGDFADRIGDAHLSMIQQTTLADALHQSGDIAKAEMLFSEAERLQAARQLEFSILSSLWGYRYCDLLLDQGRFDEVVWRATQTIKNAEHNQWPLELALDHLSLGRAHPLGSPAATIHLDNAVNGLRLAGTLHHLPKGLLARATNSRYLRNFVRAQKDLDEVRVLSIRCGMQLFLADYHLEQARLILAQTQRPRRLARAHVFDAGKLILETGYRRRGEELRKLEQEVMTD
jgi:tetratricopeptide (TPR) repeat protein